MIIYYYFKSWEIRLGNRHFHLASTLLHSRSRSTAQLSLSHSMGNFWIAHTKFLSSWCYLDWIHCKIADNFIYEILLRIIILYSIIVFGNLFLGTMYNLLKACYRLGWPTFCHNIVTLSMKGCFLGFLQYIWCKNTLQNWLPTESTL